MTPKLYYDLMIARQSTWRYWRVDGDGVRRWDKDRVDHHLERWTWTRIRARGGWRK